VCTIVHLERAYLSIGEVPEQPQHSVAAARWPCSPKGYAVVRPRHLVRRGHLPAPDQPHVGKGVVRAPVRPVTLWMHVAFSASARLIAGNIVVS
jgi:hypothetical protein